MSALTTPAPDTAVVPSRAATEPLIEDQPRRPRLRLLPPPVWPSAPADDGAIPGQQLLDLTFVLPTGVDAVPGATSADSASATGRAESSSIVPWAARLAQAVLEVVAAERPVTQLTRWVDPEIYRRLDRRQQLRTRQLDPRAPRVRCADQVRSVHVCHPAPEVAEVSVVTSGQDRCRALALRLEQRRGRWLCTALDWA